MTLSARKYLCYIFFVTKKLNIAHLSISFLINSIIIFSFNSIASSDNPFELIHGIDNRYDVADYPLSNFQKLAKSVAGRVNINDLFWNDDLQKYEYTQKKLSEQFIKRYDLKRNGYFCPNTRYFNQNILPTCSGFIIDKNILVTAGHCAMSIFACDQYVWVFDFVKGKKYIDKNDIYACDEVLVSKNTNEKYKFEDYSVIRLKRNVENRAPLKIRKKGHLKLGTPLVLIGHPLGLTMKIADSATNRFMSKNEWQNPFKNWIKRRYYFTANTDSFGGNSGSPIFNKKTGIVEGILSGGDFDEDYNEELKCFDTKIKSNKTKNVDEMYFRITKLKY